MSTILPFEGESSKASQRKQPRSIKAHKKSKALFEKEEPSDLCEELGCDDLSCNEFSTFCISCLKFCGIACLVCLFMISVTIVIYFRNSIIPNYTHLLDHTEDTSVLPVELLSNNRIIDGDFILRENDDRGSIGLPPQDFAKYQSWKAQYDLSQSSNYIKKKVNPISFEDNDYDDDNHIENKPNDTEDNEDEHYSDDDDKEESSSKPSKTDAKEKRGAVKNAMLHAWDSYKRVAWGFDELKPISGSGKNWVANGIGMTIVDALSTLWIMNLKKEFKEGVEWIRTSLDFNQDQSISVFETNIRMVGGLLSAYEMSGEKVLLEKAADCGDRLLPAFDTKTGIPRSTINLKTGISTTFGWTNGNAVLSEFGTMQLEFRRLSKLTGDDRYDRAVTKVMDIMEREQNTNHPDGLMPTYYNTESGGFKNSHVTFGALGDSYFEYLLKQWLLTGKTEERYRRMYIDMIEKGVRPKMLQRSKPSNLLYIAELPSPGAPNPKMDHLACFVAGMFALGAHTGATTSEKMKREHIKIGEEITETCVQTYRRQPTGIGPEYVRFDDNSKDFTNGANHYLLRPETIESVFYLHRITKKQKYRDWGWDMFQAIEKYCRVQNGYSGIRNVLDTNVNYDDTMQTFFLAETLKYFYLLFSPENVVNINEFVFNTEAHPLKIMKD